MKEDVYNVIWADDDIDSIKKDSDVIDIMKEEHICLLDIAHTSSELKEKLEEWSDMVDAVITDGNYDMKRPSGFDKRTTSGLTDTISLLREFNRRRYVPAYLYTGKGKMLKDKFGDGELDFFEKKGRYFEKGKFPQMLTKLKADVDHINSLEFRIHNKYVKEFEAASKIDGATQLLIEGLTYNYNDEWKDVQDYFTPARKIFERIVDKLKEQKKLPPISKLNTMGKLLADGKFEDDECFYELKKEIMPAPLAHSLQFFLDITQDGSHDNGDLKLGVDAYIRKSHNTNLFNSILFITMDLLLWYMDYSKDNDTIEEIWSGDAKYIYTGKACLSPDGSYWYTGEYELMNDKELVDGVKIGIKWGLENKKSRPGIKKFVPGKGYVIIKE